MIAEGHHPLAMDPVGSGFWNTIDRISGHVADRLNPILIKETRESLKSRQFLVTFLLLLLATVVWSVLGIVYNAPEVYYLPTGGSLLAGYYFVLAIPILGLVPLAAFRSLSGELEGDTFELMSITRLSSNQIVRGKFGSAVLQMLVYLSAVAPSLGFTYLLRGVGLAEIGMIVTAVIVSGLLLSAFALMLAPLMTGFFGQSFTMLCLIGAILFVQIVMASICLGAILSASVASSWEAWLFMLGMSSVTLALAVLFLKAASAQIAPVTENRSTPIRRWMWVVQMTWVVCIGGIALSSDEGDAWNFGGMMIAGFWLLMGTVMLCESKELSPRIRRDLPATFATRALLGPLSPGPTSGYLFAVCSGTACLICVGMFGNFSMNGAETEPILFSLTMSGYLMCYLGITRLVTLPMTRKQSLALPAALLTLLLVMLAAVVTPSIISVVLTGELPSRYEWIEIINWAWTLSECFSGGLQSPMILVAFGFGCGITLVNLLFASDLYAYRRVAVPARVVEVDSAPAS